MDLHAEDAALIPATIATSRLTLRLLVPADDAAVVAALADWQVVRWLTAVPWPFTPVDAAHFRRVIAGVPAHPHWALDAGAGLIGVISVKPDLGYWLSSRAHGQGYMSEAARAVIAAIFAVNSAPLVSGHLLDNGPSRAVLRKLGFRDTAIASVAHRATGGAVDVQRMVLTPQDWQARHA
ncbi:Protein N-acetyltransferase, RimJ/RimL family [Loktanella fryxellensis]|uniref:Protein N-acetyltransferase, RimJ/RimL family n=1 Tax=Loktanella fryxellensis TaxID=245187 RepID=A0A1H8F2C4_9RHOB|nr:GNAT family N-acetyltransferase [Loktanella fryxellensis]SEN25892.1 Protein N-acetyltransferase, RimJ/RimL family [Loktanella fryxellensis]